MNRQTISIIILGIIIFLLYRWWSRSSNGNGNGTQLTIDDDSYVSSNEPFTMGSGTTGGVLPQGNTGITGGETPLGSSSTTTTSGNPSLPTDPNCNLGGAPTGNGVCGSVPKLSMLTTATQPITPIGVDPQDPNIVPTLYGDDNVVNPVNPMSNETLSIGVCNNALNTNSNYISLLTGSPMTPTAILQFLDNMRVGYNKAEDNPNSSGCTFLKRRQFRHHSDLYQTTASDSYISSPNHRAQKQAKLDFLTATINNCCETPTTPEIMDGSGFTAVYANNTPVVNSAVNDGKTKDIVDIELIK